MAKYAVLTALLTLCCVVSSAQSFPTAYSIDYFPHLDKADGQKTVVNPGYYGDTPVPGNVCDEIYVFNHEQLLECCGCYVTPNGSRDFPSVNTAFNSNNLTGKTYPELIVKQIAAYNGQTGDYDSHSCGVSSDGSVSCPTTCDPTRISLTPPTNLRQFGLVSWAVKTQVIGSSAPAITETASQYAFPNVAEVNDLAEDCAVAIELGTGQGLCTCGGFN